MTIGIGNEWDPGDPPEVHAEGKRRKKKRTAAEFGLLLAFELGFKARESGKNFEHALADFIKENLD